MYRLPLAFSLVLAGVVSTTLAVSAATLEYTFTVPIDIKSGPAGIAGAAGAGVGRLPALSVSCAVGGPALSYSTATGGATNSSGTGKTDNVTGKQAIVIVTVDAEPRNDLAGPTLAKAGAGAQLQPKTASGYYTCWGTFASGQTPVNFLPTTAIPKVDKKV
jgi:hypothetical protein